jgi:chromosomal replication initiation ATPase DnaA
MRLIDSTDGQTVLTESHPQALDITAEYWRAYFEWRSTYGLHDDCMRELLAAIRVEAESSTVAVEQRVKLCALARMIEVALEGDRLANRAA